MRPVLSVLVFESGVALLIFVLSLPFVQWLTSVSLFVGGVIFVIPNTYFTLYAFRYQGAQWSHLIAQSFLQGQMGKLALSAVAFALVFRFYPTLNAIALFGSYGVLMVVHVAVASWVSNNQSQVMNDSPNNTERKF